MNDRIHHISDPGERPLDGITAVTSQSNERYVRTRIDGNAHAIRAAAHSPRRSGFTLVELLVVIAIIGVLVALLLPAVQAAREAARRSTCLNRLRQIALAMQNYHDVNDGFPPGATVNNGLSWNVFILPYIEQQPLYDRFSFDEGTDFRGANKLEHGVNRIDIYICPSATTLFARHGSSTLRGGVQTYTSHYYGIMGPKGTDATGQTYAVEDPNPRQNGGFASQGVLRRDHSTNMREITSGTTNTLLIGEIAHPTTFVISASTHDADFAGGDGACWVRGIGFGINPSGAAGMSASKNVVDGINLVPGLFNDQTFSSLHPGGAHFARCDASASFVSEDLDIFTYRELANRGEFAEDSSDSRP